MTSPNLPFFSLFDVRHLLPEDWEESLREAQRTEARASQLIGGTSTSLEASGTEIQISLLDGDSVARALPWLFQLYRGPLLQLAKRASNQAVVLDPVEQSAVNVNVLPVGGGGYELHVDSNPVTGLLFLSTHEHEEGGLLEMNTGGNHWLQIAPLAGTFAVFDARETPHRVTPSSLSQRISAPMNYFIDGQGRQRPADLDKRLYEG